jgi:anti-sigma B factor antagonist
MNLNAYREDKYYLIELSGELDASSCIILDQAIAEGIKNQEEKFLVDCSDLSYISSAGLGVFMSYIEEFENKNISLVLFNLNPKVKKVFQILGLDELISIVPEKADAKVKANES